METQKKVMPDLKSLRKFAGEFAKTLKGGEIIALIGGLGAGKTTFVQMLLKAMGVKQRVSSPTFVLMVPYQKHGINIFHMDLYRLSGYKDVQALGVEEWWGKKENIFLIEWADKILKRLPKKTIIIKIDSKQKEREVTISKK